MLLGGQLLRGKLVELNHFLAQDACALESIGHQDDFGDQGVIGHHHGNGPEEGFEIVREFGSAGVAGIHRDEHAESGIQGDNSAVEVEFRVALLDIRLNRQDLLGNDGQDFDVNTIEFVETGPGPALGQTGEKAAHGSEVQTVGTVEHHALHG